MALSSRVRIPSLEEAARQARYDLLAVALLLSLLSIICKAARWRALYPAGGRPELSLAVVAVAVGQVANWAIPARLGEAIRLGLVSAAPSLYRPGADRGVALGLGVLVVEKLLDGIMLLLTVALLVLVVGLPGWVNAPALVFLTAVCSGVVVALVGRGRAWRRRADSGAAQLVHRVLQGRAATVLRYLEALGEGTSAWLSPGTAMQVLLWSAAAWVLGGAVNYLVLSSLDIDLGPAAALAVLAALSGAAAVPALPGRVGVFQSLCILALLPFGPTFDLAFAFSLALYPIVYLPPIVLGLLSALLIRPSLAGRVRRMIATRSPD